MFGSLEGGDGPRRGTQRAGRAGPVGRSRPTRIPPGSALNMTWRRAIAHPGWLALVGLAALLWSRPLWFASPHTLKDEPRPVRRDPGILWVHYHERPPYYITTSTGLTGLCLEPVRRALEESGLNHRWQLTPPQRQLYWLQTRTWEAHAAVGWFRLPEREAWGRFSVPVYRDGPWVAVVRREESRVGTASALADLLATTGLTVLRRVGYSYGEWIENGLASARPVQRMYSSDTVQMLHALAAGRGDCLFMAREEAETLLSLNPHLSKTLRVVILTDSPTGLERHVMFGRGVPENWIRRFDDAMRRILRQGPGREDARERQTSDGG